MQRTLAQRKETKPAMFQPKLADPLQGKKVTAPRESVAKTTSPRTFYERPADQKPLVQKAVVQRSPEQETLKSKTEQPLVTRSSSVSKALLKNLCFSGQFLNLCGEQASL